MVKILNWNIAGANKKKATLIAHSKTEKYDVITLQETLLQRGTKFKISGYNTYTTPHENTDRGLTILVKNSIPAKRITNPIPCGINVEVLAVTLTLQDTKLDIYNIYRKLAQGNTGELDLIELFAHTSNTNTLITGDFNAHHNMLSSPSTSNEAGQHIAQLLEDFPNTALLNNGQPTHIRGGRLDLSFISTPIRALSEWNVHPTLMSDHFATKINIETPQLPPIPPPPPRWNQELADWNIFHRELQLWADNYIIPEDIDLFEQQLVTAIHAAADKAMPKKSVGNFNFKDSWYYCEEVRMLKTRLNRVRKLYRKRPTQENRELLTIVNNDTQQRLTEIRTEKWMEWCTTISQQTNLAKIWHFLKMISGKHKQPQATHPHPREEAERLANKFADRTKTTNLSQDTQQMQEQLAPMRNNAIEQACQQVDITDIPYSLHELRQTYKRGKDTAPGADKITYTMIACLGEAGELMVLKLINKTHLQRKRPENWNKQDTQPIPKPKDPENPRPIALVSCVEKTAEKMVLKRLQYKTGPLDNHLYAYQEGISTTECITDVLSYIDGKKAVIAFIDYEKAFELASPTVMLYSLVQKGIKGHLLAWTKNYLQNRKARVKFQGHLSNYKDLENGTPQGGIISPFLFNILMENIAKLTLPNNVEIFIFADDVCLVAKGSNKYNDLQRGLNEIALKTKELGLKVSTNKTKLMAIKCNPPERNICMDGNPIEWVNSYMYLGIQIDSKLTFKQEVSYLREKAKARLSTMKHMTTLKEGANFEIQRKYYIACTRSLVDYAAPVLNNLQTKQLESLEVIQNNAARLMLGAPMWTRLCNLRMEANLPSLDIRIKARNTCILSKILSSSRESHCKRKARIELAKHREIQNYNTYSKHLTDCAKDLKLTNTLLNLKADVPIILGEYPPWESIGTTFKYTKLSRAKDQCSQIELRTAAETAINNAEQPESIVYYTDGTVDPDTKTAGAAVYSNNYTGCWRITDTASTMQTELIALKQALLHSIEKEKGPVTVHTDCKSAVQALQTIKVKENKSLIMDIRRLLYQHKIMNRQVTINWIPSHIGIIGNDKADELAKTTKYIDNVQIRIQPTTSQIKSMMAPAIIYEMKKDIRNHASGGSPSANWYILATDLKPHNITKNTPRELAVVIHRLRLGYKANWQMIQGVNLPCKYCEVETNLPLLHYLLECPNTINLRRNRTAIDLHDPGCNEVAAKLCREIVEEINDFSDLLLEIPPPR